MKETVMQYGKFIENVTSEIRRDLGEMDSTNFPGDLLEYVELRFFDRNDLEIDINCVTDVVESIYRRIKSRYGIVSDLIEDDSINEIMINGPNNIFIEQNGAVYAVDDAFASEDELENLIRMFAGDVHREINEVNPIVDARLPNGFRVNGVLKNVALNGPILTIRKFSEEEIGLCELEEFGSITRECSLDLQALVKCGYNIFISGGTSSGKTTFLNALASAIDESERAVIIEDSAELKINHLKNKVHLECRMANSIGKGEITMEKLIKTSLRMRPDRIIVGEVRGCEVVDMIQAMNTGHSGSMSTGHGNSIRGMLNRLESMYMMDSVIPIHSVKSQIANAIDIFVHLKRDKNGMRRVVEVAEMIGFDGSDYKLNYLYVLDSNERLVSTGNALRDRDRLKRGMCDDRLQGI